MKENVTILSIDDDPQICFALGELFKFQGSITCFHRIRRAIRNAAFCVRRTRVNHKYTNLCPFFLILQKFGKVRLRSIGNTDHSFDLIVDYFSWL